MARIRRFALPLALLIVAVAAATAAALPVVDYTVPASQKTEPVILTGAQLGDWSTPADASVKLPATDFPGAAGCFADDQSTDCDTHNHYAKPEGDASPNLPSREPIDHFLGFRWGAKKKKGQGDSFPGRGEVHRQPRQP